MFGDQPRLLKWNPDWIDQTDIFWCQISWGKFSQNECYWKMLLLHDPIILCCPAMSPVGCCRYGKISQNCKQYWRSFVNAIVQADYEDWSNCFEFFYFFFVVKLSVQFISFVQLWFIFVHQYKHAVLAVCCILTLLANIM